MTPPRTPEPIRCSACGAPLPADDADACPACGADLTAEFSAIAHPTAGRGTRLLATTVLVCLAAMLVVAVAMLLRGPAPTAAPATRPQ